MNEYGKLHSIIQEIDTLIAKKVTQSEPEFSAWKIKAERFLVRKYGQTSYEFEQFGKIKYSLPIYTFDTPHSRFVSACESGLRKAQAVLLTYLEEIGEEQGQETEFDGQEDRRYCDNVFIVHGHNGEIREAVARLLEKQGLKPIILQEQANQGVTTIIEKFEANSDVGCAICLFTADDAGYAIAEGTERKRARQNVVFETGYFIGKLQRKNVIIIADKDVEIPSDLHGVVFTDSDTWKFKVLQELKKMGFNIDYNKID